MIGSVSADSIGNIEEATGNVGLIRSEQTVVVGAYLPEVELYDTATTGNGRMLIRFLDKAKLSLTEHTKVLIDEVIYDPNPDKSKMAMKMVFGTARFASGTLGTINKKNIKIETPTAKHPLIRTHPETGKKAIYVNRTFTTGIDGMSKEESSSILNFLFNHCEHVNYQIRYRWSLNDMAFWDNRCAMHRAIWDYWPNERKGRRVTIKGDIPK